MSSKPKVTEVRVMGKTTDYNSISVKVERTAWLNPDLTHVVERSVGRIHLVMRDGYGDPNPATLDYEQADRLRGALEAAMADVQAAENWTPTTATTEDPA